MKARQTVTTAGIIAITTIFSAAWAEKTDAVQSFYDLLSNPGSESHAQSFMESTAEGWESIGDYSGKNKTKEMFVGQMGGFSKLIPDMNWQIEERIEADDKVIVRSRATGTPSGPFFGVNGEGRSFDILTIDIHTLKDGMITQSYHVEDWAGALQQLSGKTK